MKALIWDGAYFLPRLSTQASPLSPVMILYGTRSMSFLTIGSVKRRPTRRLIANNVFEGLVTAWRLAAWPTRRSPDSVNATIDGVVRAPSLFSMTLAALPSITATHEFVVPRSIPITLLMETSCQKQDRTARSGTAPVPREMTSATVGRWVRYKEAVWPGQPPQPYRKRNVRSNWARSRDRFRKLSYRYPGFLCALG